MTLALDVEGTPAGLYLRRGKKLVGLAGKGGDGQQKSGERPLYHGPPLSMPSPEGVPAPGWGRPLFSPEGATANSQGYKPLDRGASWDRCHPHTPAPKGRQKAVVSLPLAPLRGS